MFLGKSQQHVKQNEGKCFSVKEVRGYYNDFTEKIIKYGLPCDKIPITKHDNGTSGFFPIEIFQYGLAAYDLFLLNGNQEDLVRFRNCVQWALTSQEKSGAWKTFYLQNPSSPYSAMAQGEGASLLLRAYILTKNSSYIIAAKKALDFMLIPITEGGTSDYGCDGIVLKEFTYLSPVFNGWIYAAWGLFDYYKVTGDLEILNAWNNTLRAIKAHIKEFDNGYWSNYSFSGAISSSHYHRIHIAQLSVLAKITGDSEFKRQCDIFRNYSKHINNRIRATLLKIYQKLKE